MNTKIKINIIVSLVFMSLASNLSAQYPNFLWAKQMGSVGNDYGNSIAVDANGNVYTTGTFSNTVDFNPNPDSSYLLSADSFDVFVSKFNSSGDFVWAKKMGGAGSDGGSSIAIDVNGNIYITGSFQDTSDFDPGTGTFKLISAGGSDIFVSMLNNSGDLVWAKKMGGVGNDFSYEIAVNAGGVYTTGKFEYIADFDPGNGTLNLVSAGGFDIFVSMLDNVNGDFLWARRMGGTTEDSGNSIAVAANGDICTTGTFTGTADFGNDSLMSASANDVDSYVCRLDVSGNCIWTTHISGGGIQISYSITVDAIGKIYLTGIFQGTIYINGSNAGSTPGYLGSFVFKIDSLGNRIWSRQFGGPNGNVLGSAIAVDAIGNVYSTGYFYGEADFNPLSANYYLTSVSNTLNITDIFASKLDASGNFSWVVQLGGATTDFCSGITVDANGSVYLTGGFSTTADFDPAASPLNYTLTSEGNYDVFVEKLCQIDTPIITASGTTTLCQGQSVTLMANLGETYLWSNGETTQSITIDSAGYYSVNITYPSGCSAYSSSTIVTVNPLPTVDLGADITIQQGQNTELDATGMELTYEWSTTDTTPKIPISTMGTYSVTVTNKFGCTAADTVIVTVIISIEDQDNKYKITALPNPAQDIIYIKCDGSATSSVELVNNLGQILLEDNSFAQDGALRTLQLGKIPIGTYQIRVTGKNFNKVISILKI